MTFSTIPRTFVETNAGQMFAYAIYRGVEGGWLAPSLPGRPPTGFGPPRTRRCNRYGLVPGVCGAPTSDRLGTATEGQAFFLLMEAAPPARGVRS